MESGGEIVPVHNSVDTLDAAAAAIETVNAAAAAILTAGSRRQHDVLPRRKWADRLGMYFCFGSQKNGRRINHAALVPEPTPPRTDAPAGEIPNHPPPPVFPFVAPPSSPASLLQSEPSSIAQSPSNDAQPFSLNSPSPTSPPSIFAIGPYANETEVVSPPVFSAFTTESSTAAFTPPESVHHLTTPSSPEVPYAKLLTSVDNSQNGETVDLQSYPNWPDSPIVHLISPCSGYSGTSSPFPDPETPKIFDGEGTGTQKLIPRNMRNGYFLLDGHITAAVPVADFSARLHHNDHDMDHLVSFDLTVADVARRLEKKTAILGDSATTSFRFAPSSGDHKRDLYHDLPEKVRQSLSLRLPREFNINVIDAPNVEPTLGNDKVAAGITVELEKARSYPVVQQGAS
ncbi:uncharacterized protein LOC101755086 [Setaria italica]|nr:uncharacterized protein LOC101755086 [Setaria italica]